MNSTPMKNSKHDVSKSMTLEDSTPMGGNRAVRKLSKTAKTSNAEKFRMAAKLKPYSNHRNSQVKKKKPTQRAA